jgi:hypothetical protein
LKASESRATAYLYRLRSGHFYISGQPPRVVAAEYVASASGGRITHGSDNLQDMAPAAGQENEALSRLDHIIREAEAWKRSSSTQELQQTLDIILDIANGRWVGSSRQRRSF